MKRLIINESERELIKLLHESAIKNEKKNLISEANGQTKEEYQACVRQMGSPKEVYTGQWSIAGIKSLSGYKFYSNMRAMTPNSVMTNYSCSGNKIVIDGKTYTVSSGKKSYGYYIKQAQTLLGVPTTGIVDDKTLEAAKGIQNTYQTFSGATANSGTTTTTTTVSPVTTTSSDL